MRIDRRVLVAAAVATVGFGLATILEKEALLASSNSSWKVTFSLLYLRGGVVIVGVFVQLLLDRRRPETRRIRLVAELKQRREWLFGALSSLFSVVGTIEYITALTWMSVMAVTVLFSLYPAVTYVFDVALKREQMSWKRAGGIWLMILAGIAAFF